MYTVVDDGDYDEGSFVRPQERAAPYVRFSIFSNFDLVQMSFSLVLCVIYYAICIVFSGLIKKKKCVPHLIIMHLMSVSFSLRM